MTHTNSPARFTRRTCGYLAAAGLVSGIAGSAAAASIAFEGFDYAVGSAVVGANGGTGWGGAWASGVEGARVDSTWEIAAGSLNGDDTAMLATVGNSATLTGDTGENLSIVRPLSGAFNTFAGGSQTWVSFTIEGGSGVAGAGIVLSNNEVDQQRIQFNPNNTTLELSGVVSGSAAVPTVDGQDRLIIARVTKNYDVGGDLSNDPLTIDVWYNPGDITSEFTLGAPVLTATNTSGNFAFDTVELTSNFFVGLTIDEIRLANESFGDLGLSTVPDVVIPEPASIALLGLGGLAILGRHRKS
ncbi:MAG: PEP-CTERM sorting domain-containing protein [Planctomycetota bacterium]